MNYVFFWINHIILFKNNINLETYDFRISCFAILNLVKKQKIDQNDCEILRKNEHSNAQCNEFISYCTEHLMIFYQLNYFSSFFLLSISNRNFL